MTRQDYEAIARAVAECTHKDGSLNKGALVLNLITKFNTGPQRARFDAIKFIDACYKED